MTATVATTTVHVIGKCPVKGCKNRRRNTIENAPIKRSGVYTYTDWQIPAPFPALYGLVHARLGKSSPTHGRAFPPPSQYLAVLGRAHPLNAAWFAAVTDAGWVCTDHDRFMVTVVVEGVVNESKPCSAACRGATSRDCDCVCGGDGHGSNWGER